MKTSDLKGKAVISVPGGEVIGTVDGVLLHPAEQSIGALLIKADRFAALQLVLAKDIGSISGDAVTITGADKLRDQTRFSESQQLVNAEESKGRQVATASGLYVGKLAEINIDPLSGKITGYEVTGGLFARMFGRTHTIDASHHTRLGRDLLIVADELLPTTSEATPVPE